MGLNIVLEDEEGVKLDEVVDQKNLLHRLLPSQEDSTYNCLRFVDWYGDTTFNRLQMPLFLEEWKSLEKRAKTQDEFALLRRVEGLALRCRDEIHLYLKFYGD